MSKADAKSDTETFAHIDSPAQPQEVDKAKIEQAVRMILEAIGENPDREGLVDTPKRVARMYEEVFSGMRTDPGHYFDVIFGEDHEELVLVKDIPFFSMCEHHLVPFFGKAHVAYIPKGGRVTGLSKLARAVEAIARRPQLQERITSTVADTMVEKLDPHGVVVVVEAEHMCMTMRGVKKPGAKTVTSAVRGCFEHDAAARAEVFSLIKG
ncbi:GTP cyclohydrolase 1 [Caldalkalibacillus thermarum TA2.A1]|uniref:GTP cyclohydrolase 1 n=1 Tax=Caldalkalibacillus thermarum (strain TA2.A1) TaxID=986075 RepID=F5L718_CALTT|nr:GTP cyclohydrolase I FolE [Caldalkalibacillus thermarum]EGL82853.1 GTP cyclohydrolase 1 [Caldalkalibacillus thermarum TA2.A1]QZT32707.1 GTP cyclohydrolase I FolE [Caldalkalibacillus thermarum TA2.A1]